MLLSRLLAKRPLALPRAWGAPMAPGALLAGRRQFHIVEDEALPGVKVQYLYHQQSHQRVQLPTGEVPGMIKVVSVRGRTCFRVC